MWGRKIDTWLKYFIFAAAGIGCALYLTYQEFVQALEKQNREHTARMKRLSRDILTPKQLRSLLKDRLESEINEHRFDGELKRGRIKRNVPNYDKLHPIDKKILEFIDVVEHHNRKRNHLRNVIKEEIMQSIETVIDERLPKSMAVKHVTSKVNDLFSMFTNDPGTPKTTRSIVLPWDRFARSKDKGQPTFKIFDKIKNKSLNRRRTPEDVNEEKRKMYKRFIQEELTDEYINSAGFQLSDNFFMSGPSKDLFITHKWRTWLIFTGIQIVIYFVCFLGGLVNSCCSVLTRVLSVVSYGRCLCRRCLQCRPRDVMMEMAVKFFEFFDVEIDVTSGDSSGTLRRFLPFDFPVVMGRTVLGQLEPYKRTNRAIRHSYKKIQAEVEQLESEMESRQNSRRMEDVEKIIGIDGDDDDGGSGDDDDDDEISATSSEDVKLSGEDFHDEFYENELGRYLGEDDETEEDGVQNLYVTHQSAGGKSADVAQVHNGYNYRSGHLDEFEGHPGEFGVKLCEDLL